MGLTFEQKIMYHAPDMILVTVPGIRDYIECIIEDTPENRELLQNDPDFRRGNKKLHIITNTDLNYKICKGVALINKIKEQED